MNTIFCKLVMPSHMFRKTVRLDSQIHYMCVYMRTCMYIYCMYICVCMYVPILLFLIAYTFALYFYLYALSWSCNKSPLEINQVILILILKDVAQKVWRHPANRVSRLPL